MDVENPEFLKNDPLRFWGYYGEKIIYARDCLPNQSYVNLVKII